jgi:FtsP/CotA-like multicopper oxidase with cupredoxin domain
VRRKLLVLLAAAMLCAAVPMPVTAKNPTPTAHGQGMGAQKPMTNKQRKDAAIAVAKAKNAILADAKAHGKKLTSKQLAALAVPGTATTMLAAPAGTVETGNPGNTPLATPDYFGSSPNYANSQLPTSVSIQGDGTGAFATATVDPATGAVTGFNVISQGTGYTFANVVVIGGGGSNGLGLVDPATQITAGSITGITLVNGGSGYGTVSGIRKFVDALPMPNGTPNANGQYLPVAVPDTTTFAGVKGNAPAADYYEIAVVQYSQKLHDDMPATTLRGYVQVWTPNLGNPAGSVPKGPQLFYPDASPILDGNGQPVYAVAAPQYLGPVIVAQTDRPVRIKFDNYLAGGAGGDLFLPVDPTIMGAGMGPNGMTAPATGGMDYSQNRATLHLHGGVTPWISDGTPDQWTTPTTASEQYPKGVSTGYVPDQWYDQNGNDIASCDGYTTCAVANSSTNPGPGRMTFYYTNQQSARLMFYHDHAYGITRLNVYAGEAAGYLLQDQAEAALKANQTLPSDADQIPLVIQDKTFVPDANQLAAEDPTWDQTMYGGAGNLWFPHVYMTNQDPAPGMNGANPMGRWDYGHWFWPVFTTTQPEAPNPRCLPTPPAPGATPANPGVYDCSGSPGENPFNPGIPNPSIVPEGFMDTMLVNGTPYPYTQVGPHTYRLRILNASNDRTLNLSLFVAGSDSTTNGVTTFAPCTTQQTSFAAGVTNPCSEVAMVPAVKGGYGTTGYVAPDMLDGRDGGVPDSNSAGPRMVQIGTEGGFLSSPVTLKNAPVGYNYNRRDVVVLNVSQRSLTLGPAERADVVVDFSGFSGKNVILYNDSPAPMPAYDTRYDFYTGDPDQVMNGGAPTTQPGYGPNTRTVMQFQVGTGTLGSGISPNLTSGIQAAYKATQPAPVVPEQGYDAAFGTTSPADPYARIQTHDLKFQTGTVTGITLTSGGSGYVSPPTVVISGGGGTGATAVATLAGTGIVAIQMTSGGSGYTSQPTVSFTGGGGSGAAAFASYQSSVVTGSLPTTSAGSGYTTPPSVTFNGDGTGAAATSVLAPSGVASVSVTAGGSYTTPPAVTFTGNGSGATATALLGTGPVATGPATMSSGGSGYTSAPSVSFTGGGGSGATGTATLTPTSVGSLTLTSGGTLYTAAPTVSFSSGAATATTKLSLVGSLGAITLSSGGTGYTRVPAVSISGGGGSGATAAVTGMTAVGVGSVQMVSGGTCSANSPAPTVTFTSVNNQGSGATGTASIGGSANNRRVTGITVTNAGSGYTLPPTISFSGGVCTGVSANAYLRPTSVAQITITARGQGYTTPPRVSFTSGGGSGASATSSLAFPVGSITLVNGGSGYTAAPTLTLTPATNGQIVGGATATATATLTPTSVASMTVNTGGSGYATAPTVVFSAGGGAGAAATVALGLRPVASVTVTAPGSYSGAPTVGFDSGTASATATLLPAGVASINITNGGAGYTKPPTVSFSATGAQVAPTASVTLAPASITGLTLTAGGSGYTTPPTVVITPVDGNGSGAAGTAQSGVGLVGALTITNPGSGFVGNPTVTFVGGGGSGATATAVYTAVNVDLAAKPMGIQELFDPNYGRMNATMSVEIPNTNGTTQTTIPYGYVDPPTDVVNTADGTDLIAAGGSLIESLPDGTQIWRFTHNGVDTHSVHFHMFNLELINRVGWDGAVRAPDPNEMGWKETIRMSPLEDAFVAIKPIVPNLPWPLPNSIRPLDVTDTIGGSGIQYTNVDPNGNPVTVLNHLVNFGWEYVYHCHLLGHEENDMMRPLLIGVAPVSPSDIAAVSNAAGTADVTFTDNSPNETQFTVQRSTDGGATWAVAGTVKRAAPALNPDFTVADAGASVGGTVSFHDSGLASGTPVVYRALAQDVIGDTGTAGYANYVQTVNSVPSAMSSPVIP